MKLPLRMKLFCNLPINVFYKRGDTTSKRDIIPDTAVTASVDSFGQSRDDGMADKIKYKNTKS